MFQKIINKLNDLRPRQLLILAGAAAVLMFITIYLGMTFLVEKDVVQIPEEEVKKEKPIIEMVKVVTARVNIQPRTRIQESMLQMKEFPASSVSPDSITSFDEVLNIQIKVPIFAGDVLTRQKITEDKSAEGFIGTIPLDCRAVSISVNDITGVAGFAKPGDHVDLLFVEKGNYSATAVVLLQNVLLLSINQDMGNSMIDVGNASTAISNPTIATFALHPREILKLISASKLGEIYLSLRPEHPRNNYVDISPYTVESINAPQPKSEPVPVIPNVPSSQIPAVPMEPPVPKIEIIQGDQITQKADNAPIIVAPTSPNGVNPPLPVIPSNSANIPEQTPLADAPFVQSNIIRPPSNN